ncbi:hypothetical protein J8I87_00590 [Paraburkholderia sp. LEh10]|uniref:hypothetical protein n=1 Tax=Paraburkholderia sp. LEh10 TaxID=2821353 RepID=UPI001AE79D1D|nr:hypothetical protein [Paraburkholderia sp. LEh10]MBP0588243.1 hypothetical protein [Paraburkholderia sp. LEh10]
MFNSAILEVAIGIVFIYLMLSILCTALREGIEGFLKTRASYLEYAIRELLHDPQGKGLTTQFFNHPLIFSLFPGGYSPAGAPAPSLLRRGRNLPSYIPSASFAVALMDLAARGPAHGQGADTQPQELTFDELRRNVQSMANPAVRRVLMTALDTAAGDINRAKKNLEHWYDSAMDRVSGRYKRSTQLIIFVLGAVIAVGFNVNTISLADYLYRNQTVRGAIVAQAQAASNDPEFLKANFERVKDKIDNMELPIGWDQPPALRGETRVGTVWHVYLVPVLGWLLTAFAITLGAPFWFDVLNKIMVIRSTVKPHEKSPEEASEDRQLKRPDDDLVPASSVRIVGGSSQHASSAVAFHDSEDGCDATVEDPTLDTELPAARGGVA